MEPVLEPSTSSDLNPQKAKLLKQSVGRNRPCMWRAVMVLMLIRQGEHGTHTHVFARAGMEF